MSYQAWFKGHGEKHRKIVEKLKTSGKDSEEIIAYFDFDNMVENEPDFCPLYVESKKCHAMEKLNCYLCACPFFRFNDQGIAEKGEKRIMSACSIDSKKGKEYHYKNEIHQDCSDCLIPHKVRFIQKEFDMNWFDIMKACEDKNGQA